MDMRCSALEFRNKQLLETKLLVTLMIGYNDSDMRERKGEA